MYIKGCTLLCFLNLYRWSTFQLFILMTIINRMLRVSRRRCVLGGDIHYFPAFVFFFLWRILVLMVYLWIQTSHAIAASLNVVQTSHSYGDLMLLNKASELKLVCVCVFYFILNSFICFYLSLLIVEPQVM